MSIPLSDQIIEVLSSSTNNLIDSAHGICPVCHGPMCEHDICIDNWCGMDHHCTECADREWAEIEAEDNAKYYEGNFE